MTATQHDTAALDGLARRQHGVVRHAELLALGFGQRRIQRWVETGRLVRIHPLVYVVAGAPRTWQQRVLAAVLAAGPCAAASHRAAAWLWDLLEGRTEIVELSVLYPRAPRLAGVVVHRSLDLVPSVITRRQGIPVTNPLRALVDLGAVVPPQLVADALERGLVQRRFSIASVERARAGIAKPGRNGSGVLRGVLDRRALEAASPDSLLEPRMATLLKAALLPPAVFQFDVLVNGLFVARVDFAYPNQRLAIEVDGWESRATSAAMQADLDRQNALVQAGWTVLRFTWADVVRRPHKVATAVRRALCAAADGQRP